MTDDQAPAPERAAPNRDEPAQADVDTVVRPVEPGLDGDPSAAPPGGRRRRVLTLVGGGVLALLAVAYLVGYLLAGEKLPRNATIEGIPVGGLSRAAAIAKLSTELEPRARALIGLTIADHPAEIDPAAAGLSIDYAASVDAAGGGRSLDPRQILRVLIGGQDTDLEIAVDEAALAAAIVGLAKTWDGPPADATLGYSTSAKVKLTKARDGITLDQSGAGQVVADAYPSTGEVVALPAEVVAPDVTTAEAEQVSSAYAKPAVSGDIVVSAGAAGSFRVKPAMIAAALTFVPAGGTLAPNLDAKALRTAAASAVAGVELKEPRNATVRIVAGKPKVIAAVDGTTVTAAELAKAVEPALSKAGKDRRATVALSGAKAKFTTDDAKALRISEVTGQFTTHFPYAYYRNVNIGRAAQKINGTVLKPGEVFSLNGIVGERTRANGFVEGYIISGGRFRKELGGGVSQSATTTFNAMFFAGLQDVMHRPHGLYIDRYPPGREATVAWPSLDLKFKNDTPYGVLVQAYVSPSTPSSRGSITVKMWSTKVYTKVLSSELRKSNFTTGRDIRDDDPDCEPTAPVQGFDVNYARLFYKGDTVVKRESFFWRYAPTDRVICT